MPRGTLHAHVIRSPHAHANIVSHRCGGRAGEPGVGAVITGEDVRKLTDPFLIALKQPVHQWSLAVERVRYVGEAVALVVAESRYVAEDAAELVEVEYEPLAAVIDPSPPATGRAAAASGVQDQRDIGPQIRLRRHRGRVRQADASRSSRSTFPGSPSRRWNATSSSPVQPADNSYDVLANSRARSRPIR